MEPDFAAKLEAAATHCLSQQQQQQQQQRALPPVTETYEELMTRSIKELKAMLTERGIPCADCLEKGDLAKRISERCSKVTYYA
jgi:flagellar motility protein MotE (MotC chaperone)